jgi:hypothetical protein
MDDNTRNILYGFVVKLKALMRVEILMQTLMWIL